MPFLIDCCSPELIGVRKYGVHINGYFYTEDGSLVMWIGKRSILKPKYPGLLDNIVCVILISCICVCMYVYCMFSVCSVHVLCVTCTCSTCIYMYICTVLGNAYSLHTRKYSNSEGCILHVDESHWVGVLKALEVCDI